MSCCKIVITILLINLVVHIKNKFLIIIFGNINNIMTFTYCIYVAYSYFSLDLLWQLKLINIFIYSAAYL